MGQSEPTRNLALELVRVTEAAALSAGRLMGRGDKEAADGAAVKPGRDRRAGREPAAGTPKVRSSASARGNPGATRASSSPTSTRWST